MAFIDTFTDNYLQEFGLLYDASLPVLQECFEKANISTIENRCALLKEPVNALRNFSNAKSKIKAIEDSLAEAENIIQDFTNDSDKTKTLFSPMKERLERMIKCFNGALESINIEIERVLDDIVSSPYNKPEHGLVFQKLILDFFDIIFVHELVKEDLPIMKQKKIKLDGYYRKDSSFDAKGRTGFEFSKLIIECKNKRANVDDLMQCFKYTLYFQTTEISKVPLTLLVCRSSPGRNSTIWEINKTIFNRPIADETRLILILTIDDLKEMKRIKFDGGDPFKVIKDKINEFN